MAGDVSIPRIATEEAFAIPEQCDRYRALSHSTWSSADVVFWGRILNGPKNRLVEALLDLDELRLADMDENGVDVQLLLLTSPGVRVFDVDTQQTPECVEFMDSAPLSAEDGARIYAGNAERTFGIRGGSDGTTKIPRQTAVR
jgi:hypothetical protein